MYSTSDERVGPDNRREREKHNKSQRITSSTNNNRLMKRDKMKTKLGYYNKKV